MKTKQWPSLLDVVTAGSTNTYSPKVLLVEEEDELLIHNLREPVMMTFASRGFRSHSFVLNRINSP